MADPDQSPWVGLPNDILYKIAPLIPCEIDRLRMDVVCRSWHVALAQLRRPPPSPVPWLILPAEAHGRTFSCILSGCRTHPFFIPHGARRRSRYFGSYDGAWLFLAVGGQAQDHALLNLNNFQLLDLPNVIRSLVLRHERHFFIVAATLSCQPTEQGCIVAGIIDVSSIFPVGSRQIAFWHMGDQVVLPSLVAEELPGIVENLLYCSGVLEDLLYHNGAFLFLTRMEHICVCEELIFLNDHVEVGWAAMYFQPRGDDAPPELVLARYLVESRGKLLMVVRYASATPQRHHSPVPTLAFRVFQREDQMLNDGEVHHQYQHYWRELLTLDGRMLFVGRGCSRSYDVADKYPGLEGVYFLDDRNFRDHDPTVMALNDAAEQLYSCSDNGRWTGTPPRIKRCFPEQGPSNCSPPVWVLP